MAGEAPPAGLDEFLGAAPVAPQDAMRAPAMALPQPVASPSAPPPGLDEFLAPDIESQYGSIGQQALTGLEGAAKGFAGPIATGVERGLHELGVPGISPQEQEMRAKTNPWTHGLAEAGGFGAGILATAGQARVLGAVGEAAAGAAGLAEAATPLAKIGSLAVRAAAENAAYQAGDEVSKFINGSPEQSAQSAIADVGLSAAIGGVFGGGIGSGIEMWKATAGKHVGEVLSTIANKAGGVEGQATEGLGDVLAARAGLELAPEIKSAISGDPRLSEVFTTLSQSDTTRSGQALQKTLKDTHAQLGDVVGDALGRTAKEVPDEFDKFTNGKKIGETLAKEYEAQVNPLVEGYDKVAARHKDIDLAPSVADRSAADEKAISQAEAALAKANRKAIKLQKAGSPEAAIEAAAMVEDAKSALVAASESSKAPGTTDVLADKIADLANREGWSKSPSSDIMKKITELQKELPGLKTVGDLSQYIQRVGENMQSDPMNGPLRRAGGMIKSLLRDHEGELIGNRIGSEEGENALKEYRELQKSYAEQAKIRDELESRLHAKGSTSGYAKSLREMATSDGERVFDRLSGKNDASLLDFINEKFPGTAQAIREAHIEKILAKSKDGEFLDPSKVLKGLDQLQSPQLRQFLVPEAERGKLDAVEQILSALKDRPHNYSNTARTLDKLMQYVPGSAVGLATMVATHNPVTAATVGYLSKLVAKDAPDAARLALLKWMGSGQPIESGAFKTMVHFIQTASKGEALLTRAAKGVFSPASSQMVQSYAQAPSEGELKKLDKRVSEAMISPSAVEKSAQHVSYYMPDHGIAFTASTAKAVNYLKSLKPGEVKAAPLDPVIKPSAAQLAEYHRALSIAEKPISIMGMVQRGTITEKDVQHLKTMYPAYHQRLCQKVSDSLVDHVSKGEPVPYQTRMGLSVLLGQPMDSSLKSANIQANQNAFMQKHQEQAQQNQAQKAHVSKTAMKDMKASSRMSLARTDGE